MAMAFAEWRRENSGTAADYEDYLGHLAEAARRANEHGHNEYPPDGTPFELDSETIGLLYKAVADSFMTTAEKAKATRAVDYISAATLVVVPGPLRGRAR
jgi:hypothetical protein